MTPRLRASLFLVISTLLASPPALARAKKHARSPHRKVAPAQSHHARPAAHHIALGPKIALQWSDTLQANPAFTPGFRAFLLAGSFENKDFSGMTRVEPGRTPATQGSVQRSWRESLGALARQGDRVLSQSCRRLRHGAFRCDRQARARTGQYVADFMLWYRGQNLVYVRINSEHSARHAADVMKQFDVVLQ
jgi:hypothetical protein